MSSVSWRGRREKGATRAPLMFGWWGETPPYGSTNKLFALGLCFKALPRSWSLADQL